MSEEIPQPEHTSLGLVLREARLTLEYDLAAAADHTKISPKNLQAMEDDRYDILPAKAFTRGLYTIYANFLQLDSQRVLELYERERKSSAHKPASPLAPHLLAKEVGNMAERPSSLPLSLFGLVVLLLLLIGAFLSWYFSWNPATFLSQKLRGVEQPPETVLLFPTPLSSAFADGPTLKPRQPLPAPPGRYSLSAQFAKETDMQLQIDNHPDQQLSFKGGETTSWRAEEKMLLTLPADSQISLTLNDIPINIPPSEQKFVTIAIPEAILQ